MHLKKDRCLKRFKLIYMSKKTDVALKEAKYGRMAYLILEDNMVVFDDSDGEYGPVSFPIDVLKKAIEKHESS